MESCVGEAGERSPICGARPRGAQVSRDDMADAPNANRNVEERKISVDGSGESPQE